MTESLMQDWEKRLASAAEIAINLSNTEIQQLRQLAVNGGPLARIISFLLDSADELSKNVFGIDISTDAGKQKFLEAQAQNKALKTCSYVLGACLTPETAEQEKADD